MKKARDENPQTYADFMRIARVNAGVTIEQLAKESGVSKAMISRIESGASAPTIVTADKLASALCLTIDEYINGVVPRG